MMPVFADAMNRLLSRKEIYKVQASLTEGHEQEGCDGLCSLARWGFRDWLLLGFGDEVELPLDAPLRNFAGRWLSPNPDEDTQ
jgi:hypothetical protein